MASDYLKYSWLIGTIDRAKKITFPELAERWEESSLSDGKHLSIRSFHRWRGEIEDAFGIKIRNERHGEFCYFIENIDSVRGKELRTWLLDTISVGQLIADNKSLNERIVLEHVPEGMEHLQLLFEAMKQNKWVRMSYKAYYSNEEKSYEMMPLCVKLYRRRWYLVGQVRGTDKRKIFSLDRMSALSMLEDKFEYPQDFSAENYFYGCVGIFVADVKLEKVVLKVEGLQVNYLRDLPLHESQNEVETHEGYSIFELKIRPTFDFIQEILQRGDEIEVLEPASLREEIAAKVRKMWGMYGGR